MARPLSVFPAELVDELLFLIEELLRRFLVVVIRQQEIEPVGERALDAELQRVVTLADALGIRLLDGRVMRVSAAAGSAAATVRWLRSGPRILSSGSNWKKGLVTCGFRAAPWLLMISGFTWLRLSP